MPRSWLRIIGGIVLIFDLLTLAIYRSLNEPEDDDLETDEVHRQLLEVGTQELSHFHNQTLGTVLKAKFGKLLYSSYSYIKIKRTSYAVGTDSRIKTAVKSIFYEFPFLG